MRPCSARVRVAIHLRFSGRSMAYPVINRLFHSRWCHGADGVMPDHPFGRCRAAGSGAEDQTVPDGFFDAELVRDLIRMLMQMIMINGAQPLKLYPF